MAIMNPIKGLGLQAMIEPDAAAIDRLLAQLIAQVERWLTGA